VIFDARAFKPAIMPAATSFIVTPKNAMISTFSTWDMELKVNVPLEEDCWIQIFVPPEFKYELNTVLAEGIFVNA
jgi:hypothetical protein